MDAGPARRRTAGFALAELLLTLLVLGLVAWVVLRVVDRGTRIPAAALSASGPDAVLEAAFRTLVKDVRAAGTGGVPANEAIRPVADNTRPNDASASYRAIRGGSVAVRGGTDQLGLRGVIRTPLVRLEARVPAADTTVSERLRASPGNVPVRAPAAAELGAVRARIREAPASAKTFFLVRDAAGGWAVARIASSEPGVADGPLDLVLDFADPDARALGPGGRADRGAALGEVSAGGVFDDLVWFVAEGPAGRPPDFVGGSDPESLRYPHPYLAFGVSTGDGRWDVHGAGEDVEDLQVAWGIAGEAGALVWRADAPGSSAARADELVDALGRPRMRALRLALVARSPVRFPRSGGGPAPEFAVPLNGPAPGTVPRAAPIGWDPAPQRRIRFDRESREEIVELPARAQAAR